MDNRAMYRPVSAQRLIFTRTADSSVQTPPAFTDTIMARATVDGLWRCVFLKETNVGIPPMLFICLFLAGLGMFFIGTGFIWWVSLQAAESKKRQGS